MNRPEILQGGGGDLAVKFLIRGYDSQIRSVLNGFKLGELVVARDASHAPTGGFSVLRLGLCDTTVRYVWLFKLLTTVVAVALTESNRFDEIVLPGCDKVSWRPTNFILIRSL